MTQKFEIIFDDVMLGQLKKLGKNRELRNRISKMLDKIEELGPRAGKLLDAKLSIYEVKSKSPPIRLYFKYVRNTDQIYVFEYGMKTAAARQKRSIEKLKEKSKT